MDNQVYLDSLEKLNGKVAIVTGGSQGIGLQTTIYLAQLGASVYVCTLDIPQNQDGVLAAKDELRLCQDSTGTIEFHGLDLATVLTSRRSAETLKSKIRKENGGRLDIIVANAGTAFQTKDILSVDGVERTFAVNCLGHFVFITTLLDIVESTADLRGDARIVITSSHGHKLAKNLDYTSLTSQVPLDGSSYFHLFGAFKRYCDSKLACLYLALELDRRLKERNLKNVYVNAVHPGNSPLTNIGNGEQPLVGYFLQRCIKRVLGLVMRHSTKDAAKTQVWLSSSEMVKENHISGEYWAPKWSWNQNFTGCGQEELSTLAKDRDEWKKLWDFCEVIAQAAESLH